MRKYTLPLLLAVSLTVPLQAKPNLVNTQFLRDYAETRAFSLGRPVKPRPTPDGQRVLYLQSPPRNPRLQLYSYDVATKTQRVLLTPEQLLAGAEEKLSPEEKARRERQRISVKGFTSYELDEAGKQVLLTLSGKLYTFALSDNRVTPLVTGPGTLVDPKFAPDGQRVAYVLDNDLYTLNLATGQEQAVTTGGTPAVSHAQAEFVAQEEMSRFTGYWWSPDSQFFAYTEVDSREVEQWRIADPTRPDQEPYAQPYPRPGKNNVRIRLGVIPVGGGATTWINWDQTQYPYLASVRWDKGGPLTLVVQSRSQKQLAVLKADPKTGQTTTLVTEQDPAWINLDQDMPQWLADGSGFLWTRDREGAPQLELRDPTGKVVRVLVPPSLGYLPESGDGLSVDAKAQVVYFRASPDPTQIQLWRVSLQGGEPVRLSQGTGLFSAVYAKNHSLYVEGTTNPGQLTRYTVRTGTGAPLGPLPSVAVEPPFTPQVELVRIKNFYATLTRPQDFNPKLRYPVIVDVYGGPGVRKVTTGMGGRLLNQWLADQGFIIVTLDNRGTPRQGRDWERAIVGSFGTIPLTDQVTGLEALGVRYPELDLKRVGITGWSFGGYMSALAVLRRPDIFKAAVAGAPVTDWLDYDTHYTERYLGLPEENPQGYTESSLLTYAADLKRPLLLIHGTTDDNVFFLHTLKLSDALFKAGKTHEILPLNGFTHMVPDPNVRIRLQERIVEFFRAHLR